MMLHPLTPPTLIKSILDLKYLKGPFNSIAYGSVSPGQEFGPFNVIFFWEKKFYLTAAKRLEIGLFSQMFLNN